MYLTCVCSSHKSSVFDGNIRTLGMHLKAETVINNQHFSQSQAQVSWHWHALACFESVDCCTPLCVRVYVLVYIAERV